MVTSTLDQFVRTLAPAALDKSKVSARKQQLSEILSRSSLATGEWIESGSWSHGTALDDPYSDVDYIAPAHGNRPRKPSTALTTLEGALSGSHRDIRRTRRSSPTVQVKFWDHPHFEVVPAWPRKDFGGDQVFWIPGPRDEWAQSAPRAHLRFVNKQNDRLGKHVKPLVRLLKQWKVHTEAPVSSFYLEMRTAEYAKEQELILYHDDLVFLMGRLISHELREMNDPTGLESRISAVSSEDNRRTALGLLKKAERALAEARDMKGASGKEEPYWLRMYSVFGHSYPWPTW